MAFSVFNTTAQKAQKIKVDTDEPGRKKRSVMTQTTTYSRDKFDEKSFKIEVPPHQGNDELTVVMHAASNGYWHTGIGLSNLKVRVGGRQNGQGREQQYLDAYDHS